MGGRWCVHHTQYFKTTIFSNIYNPVQREPQNFQEAWIKTKEGNKVRRFSKIGATEDKRGQSLESS